MVLTLPKTRVAAAPWSLPFVLSLVGGLALVLMIASILLTFNPIGSTIHEYLVGIDHFENNSLVPSLGENQTAVVFQWEQPSERGSQSMILGEFKSGSEVPNGLAFAPTISFDQKREVGSPIDSVSIDGDEEMEVGGTLFSGVIDDSTKNNSVLVNGSEEKEVRGTLLSGIIDDSTKNNSEIYNEGLASSNLTSAVAHLPSPPSSNFGKGGLRRCDLYHGKWVHDPAGPLYTNNTCPILTQSQNCQGNGRPDKDYENWRWKLNQCDLPRFDARKFLELMKGKTLAFIGDSLARNHMESMLCILWQVETPRNHGNRHMHQWYFGSTSTTIVRIWSAWLVHKTTEPLPSTPQGLDKIHLDIPDEAFMEFLPRFDVVVLSSGHWFSKQSAYLLNGKIVGGQRWRPKGSRKKQIDSVKAYSIAVETTLTAIATLPNYKGLTIVRTYSPDHYVGGKWDSGGWCGRMDRPANKLVRNRHTDVMYKKQITGFERAVKKLRNGSKMRLMDITEVFGYRHDGHPGPYRSPSSMDRKRDSNGKPMSEDCVHWCMPGPVDTWNVILAEIIRREL